MSMMGLSERAMNTVLDSQVRNIKTYQTYKLLCLWNKSKTITLWSKPIFLFETFEVKTNIAVVIMIEFRTKQNYASSFHLVHPICEQIVKGRKLESCCTPNYSYLDDLLITVFIVRQLPQIVFFLHSFYIFGRKVWGVNIAKET